MFLIPMKNRRQTGKASTKWVRNVDLKAEVSHFRVKYEEPLKRLS